MYNYGYLSLSRKILMKQTSSYFHSFNLVFYYWVCTINAGHTQNECMEMCPVLKRKL